MKHTKNAAQLAEEALSSIDNIQAIEPNGFMFTRIQNKLAAKKQAAVQVRLKFLYALSFALALFIAMNLGSYYFLKQTSNGDAIKQKNNGITAFANDYKMEQSSYNY